MHQKRIKAGWLDFNSNTCPARLLSNYPGIGSHKIKKGSSIKLGLYKTQGKRIKTVEFWCLVTAIGKDGAIQVHVDDDLSEEWDYRKGQSITARLSAVLDAV